MRFFWRKNIWSILSKNEIWAKKKTKYHASIPLNSKFINTFVEVTRLAKKCTLWESLNKRPKLQIFLISVIHFIIKLSFANIRLEFGWQKWKEIFVCQLYSQNLMMFMYTIGHTAITSKLRQSSILLFRSTAE